MRDAKYKADKPAIYDSSQCHTTVDLFIIEKVLKSFAVVVLGPEVECKDSED